MGGIYAPVSSPGNPRDPTNEKTRQKGREAETLARAANFPDTKSLQPVKAPPADEFTRRACWHPHPDDDVSPMRVDEPSDAAVEMFRRHYDK
jgi:hypothetical protein